MKYLVFSHPNFIHDWRVYRIYRAGSSRLLLQIIFIVSALLSNAVQAQFNPNRYYQSCLRSEGTLNYTSARENCLSALELDPDFTAAELALVRIELATDNLIEAETRLNRVKSELQNAEVFLLGAELAVRSERYVEAEDNLSRASRSIQDEQNAGLESRLNYLQGKLAEAQNRYQDALNSYSAASRLDSLNAGYRLDAAGLLYQLGNLSEAETELDNYRALSNDTNSNPEVLSLLGQIKWSQKRYDEAISDLETAVNRRGSRNSAAQTADLNTLALIYYGQGNTQAGGLALRKAVRRGTSPLRLLSAATPWLILFILTLGLHLWGESRIATRSSLEVVEMPEMWSVGHVYGILFASLASALFVTLAFSYLRYENLLALFTPVQQTDVRAVYILSLTLTIVALTVWRIRRNGWNVAERLLGSAQQTPTAIVVGLIMLAVTLLYLSYSANIPWLSGFYLDFGRLTPLLVGAAISVPFVEMFFRGMMIPTLTQRYDPTLAVLISAALFALAFTSPIVLLAVFGGLLSEMFRRTNSGLIPLISQFVLHFGLILGVAFSPWVRGLFL